MGCGRNERSLTTVTVVHDIVIRNGDVVDGTGAGPRRADVAIDGDRITAVGDVPDEGRREIDATGRIVTPGFVDIHTHLDAQLFWDPVASPSCYHGVTTLVLGNCGVTFAPVQPGGERYMAELMESVEDIPADSIMDGMGWGWETFGEYLDALRRLPLGPNVGGLVGHCALRLHAMGERGLDEDPATDDDLARIKELVAEAIDAGALGFSSSRSYMHTVPDGRPVPGTFATPDELSAIASVLAEKGRGTIEVVPRIGERDGDDRRNTRAELEWMERVTRESGRPLTFAMMQSNRRPDLWSWVMDRVGELRAAGADLRPQTTARGVGIMFGLPGRTPFDAVPGWEDFVDASFSERLEMLRDDSTIERLATAAEDPGELSGPLAPKDPSTMFLLPAGPARYDTSPDNSLAAEAERRSCSPAEAFLRFTAESDGEALLYYPVLNQDQAAIEAMLANPDVILGVADAGAHVAMTMDAGQATYLLTRWVRDDGLMDLGRAVQRLTSEGADLFGIADRGELRPGAYADVNVIDLHRLTLHTPEMHHDFPLGASRFVQRATGYDATIVNGRVLVDHDELTDERPGTVVSHR